MKCPIGRGIVGLALITILAGLLGGCGGGTSGTSVSTNSPYKGSWSGTYAGDESGAIDMTINQDGTWSASMFGATIVGSVTDAGVVNGGGKIGGHMVQIMGALLQTNGSGTWLSSTSAHGTWSLTKTP